MPEVKSGEVQETPESTEEAIQITSNEQIDSLVDDVVPAPKEEEAPSLDEKPSSKEQSDKSAEDVKTEADDEELTDLKEGDSVPYPRLKKVVEQRNQERERVDSLQQQLDELNESLRDPAIAKAVLQKQGLTDDAIAQRFKEQGITEEEKLPEAREYDLTKQEGWMQLIDDKINQRLQPVGQKVTETQKLVQQERVNKWISEQETQAKQLAKDTYKIEFGKSSKDEHNLSTAVGKISTYLDKHPEDANLGHVKLLHLAMASEGFKQAEVKGEQKEAKRQEELKNAAMEAEGKLRKDGRPSADASIDEILAYAAKQNL